MDDFGNKLLVLCIILMALQTHILFVFWKMVILEAAEKQFTVIS